MKFQGFTLDTFQEDAIASIDNNHSVVVSAPTGSGKTLIADYIIDKYIKEGKKVIYTAPIKALSNQKFKQFSNTYGKDKIGLLTGDVVKNPEAPILIMTTEIYRNMVLTNDSFVEKISYVIFDEIHYINDRERGYVWEESIIFSNNHVRFLCLSATIPNAKEFANWIQAIKKHNVDVITNSERSVPLYRKFFDTELGVCTLEEINQVKDVPSMNYVKKRSRQRVPRVKAPNHIDLIRQIKDQLPCFFFNFSRKSCQDNAVKLSKKNIFKFNPEISKAIREKLADAPKEIAKLPSAKTLRQTLPYGIGFHHAGLIPIMKELVEELFSKGLIKVLYTTETFAVGINMPAKTVCFDGLRKFDGISFRYLNSKEYFQIAGRAGRRGIDKQGFVYAMINRRDFDYPVLKKMTDKDVDPIKSHFKLSINTVLNLINMHNQEEINIILSQNFHTYQKYGNKFLTKKSVFYHRFNNIKKNLQNLNYLNKEILTYKGNFSSMIYADEILFGEIFATDFYKQLNEFQILMIVACICYEARERTEFYQRYLSEHTKSLRKLIRNNDFLFKVKKFNELNKLTALIDPIYHGKTIFDIFDNTNLLEGDVIRFFRQILDRMGQIKKATKDDVLRDMISRCQDIVSDSMKDIDVI